MAVKRPIIHIKDGVWYKSEDSYTHICCDCNLAHRKETKLENGMLYERWIRDERTTRRLRAKSK